MAIADEIQKLHELHKSGAISEQEFADAKAKLLKGVGGAEPEPILLKPMDPAKLESETRQWSMLLHLGLLAGYAVPFAGLIVPIVIWQMKKDELPALDAHGKNAVNWLISLLIYLFAAGLLCLVFIGILILPVVVALSVIFPIIAAVKANNGELWKYPMSITFLK